VQSEIRQTAFSGNLQFAIYTFHFAILLLLVSCGQPAVQQYVPAVSVARSAVQVALEAWKSGKLEAEAGSIPGGAKLQVLDRDWRSGKKLSSFEIVRELPGAPSGPRQFRAKLTYDGEKAPVETTYHVVGIDPLLVFRDEDYRKTTGM